MMLLFSTVLFFIENEYNKGWIKASREQPRFLPIMCVQGLLHAEASKEPNCFSNFLPIINPNASSTTRSTSASDPEEFPPLFL